MFTLKEVMSPSLRRPNPEDTARHVIGQMTVQDIRSVQLAMNTTKPENVRKALDEPLRSAVHTMDDIIWDIPFYNKVKEHMVRLLMNKLANRPVKKA